MTSPALSVRKASEPELHQVFRKIASSTERPVMTVEEKMLFYRKQSSEAPMDALQMYERHVLQSQTSGFQRRSPLHSLTTSDEVKTALASDANLAKLNTPSEVSSVVSAGKQTPPDSSSQLQPEVALTTYVASSKVIRSKLHQNDALNNTTIPPSAPVSPMSPRSPTAISTKETENASACRDFSNPLPGDAVFLHQPMPCIDGADDPSGEAHGCFMCPGFLRCFLTSAEQ